MADQVAATASSKPSDIGVNVGQEVSDALNLLDYAVANGVKTTDGHPLSQDIVTSHQGHR